MSKSSSPRGCIWHVDQVSQTPGRVGPRFSRPAKVWGGSIQALVDMRLHEEEKPASVEADSPGRPATRLGRPATTWRQTDLSKSVGVPFTPINTPSQWKSTHTTHFGDSTCKTPIFSVVARRSLVGRVVRLWGPEGHLSCREPSS
jgi:hypothetical protein